MYFPGFKPFIFITSFIGVILSLKTVVPKYVHISIKQTILLGVEMVKFFEVEIILIDINCCINTVKVYVSAIIKINYLVNALLFLVN